MTITPATNPSTYCHQRAWIPRARLTRTENGTQSSRTLIANFMAPPFRRLGSSYCVPPRHCCQGRINLIAADLAEKDAEIAERDVPEDRAFETSQPAESDGEQSREGDGRA
jgi:hypothetical protein